MIINTARTCSVALALVASPAFAADPVPIEETPQVEQRMAKEWTIAIDPFYGWLPGLNGDIRVFGGSGVSVDVTTGDILHNIDEFLHLLDGLYMGSGEIRNSQIGFQWDVVYLSVGASAEFGNRITGAADMGFGMTFATLAGNYRVYESPTSYLDVLAGIRYSKIDVNFSLTLGPLGTSLSGGDSWVDPIIGVKGRHNLNENWYLKGNAIYGGFGVSSDHLYDLAGFVGYEWANGTELYGGWRHAYTDYENGAFKWDIALSGPMLGLTFKF